jgi:hypothetical protein
MLKGKIMEKSCLSNLTAAKTMAAFNGLGVYYGVDASDRIFKASVMMQKKYLHGGTFKSRKAARIQGKTFDVEIRLLRLLEHRTHAALYAD